MEQLLEPTPYASLRMAQRLEHLVKKSVKSSPKGLSPLNHSHLNGSIDASLVDHSYSGRLEMPKSRGSHGAEDLQQSLNDISSETFTNDDPSSSDGDYNSDAKSLDKLEED
ncbi:hypothetical protein QQ045_030470 [Rhodiola kirilowii]